MAVSLEVEVMHGKIGAATRWPPFSKLDPYPPGQVDVTRGCHEGKKI